MFVSGCFERQQCEIIIYFWWAETKEILEIKEIPSVDNRYMQWVRISDLYLNHIVENLYGCSIGTKSPRHYYEGVFIFVCRVFVHTVLVCMGF